MDIQTAYQIITDDAIVAGMRGHFPPDVAVQVCRTLFDEGIRSFELTMNSTQPIEAMEAVKRALGDSACVGMGTVLDPETARRVLDAGADFVVSPAFQPEVVRVVVDAGVLCAPGVITPSEAVAAWGMGVPLLKIFPIGSLGIDYFKAIVGPLNHIRFMCNGGMDDKNAGDFIKAGAVACGMASWMSGDGTWSESKLRERAQLLKASIAQGRGEKYTVRV